jgi:hypothetical protein
MATSAKLRGLGGSRAAVGRVWDCKVVDPGVVTRRARDCGRRGLPGDRLYRTGSGVAGQAGIRACGNGEGAPWPGMPER